MTETAETGTTAADADGDGVADDEDYAPNDPAVQEKRDLTDAGDDGFAVELPGFGPFTIAVAVLVGLLVVRRRTQP